LKTSKKVSKNPEFHADFKSVEKVFKKFTKKVLSKTLTEICTFSTFTHVGQTCFAYNFFVHFFKTFSTYLKSAGNSLQRAIRTALLTAIRNLVLYYYIILVLFSNFEAKRTKKAPKIKNHIK
jgi:hypothetical protein